MKPLITLLGVLLMGMTALAETMPRPLPEHPGNIFVQGEGVAVPVPADGPWSLRDADGKTTTVTASSHRLDLGELPIGYFELRHPEQARITLGVIAPLRAPTPADSPISLDVAMAWIYRDPGQERAVVNLCNLAGINWVRDRLSWPDMEPKRGTFAGHNIYDETAALQTSAGLRVLQVNHISPPWANPDPKRFPLDLRDAYAFYREMAGRWKGQVLALEPWNEADIRVFGGHTGSEMATLQKVAYLGLKAGNPNIIACQNVFAIARQSTLDDFGANEAGGYFDTYNLHHYIPLSKYPEAYAAHRAVSAGKPMWVTECNITVDFSDEKTQEPDEKNLRAAALRLVKIYATSIYEGSVNTFYFMLPHYVEGKRQYGLLHTDLMPRPAFVSLAAVGRLMAGAKAEGRMKWDDGQGYLFDARPDGHAQQVLIAWSTNGLKVETPKRLATFDYLGRPIADEGPLKLSNTPVFAVMAPGAIAAGEYDPPPAHPPLDQHKPAPVVLQAMMPPETLDLERSAYILPPSEPHELTLRAYNFGTEAAEADLTSTLPQGWAIDLPGKVRVDPGQMGELKLKLHERPASQGPQALALRWGEALLSFRLVDAGQQQ